MYFKSQLLNNKVMLLACDVRLPSIPICCTQHHICNYIYSGGLLDKNLSNIRMIHVTKLMIIRVCSEGSVGRPNESPHDKTNKLIRSPSEDSDQPGHPASLIRGFTVRVKKGWVLSYL